MTAPILKFLALVLGFAMWGALGYFGKVPLDPLIALLQMGLGGLITHMLQADAAGAMPAAPSPAVPAAPPAVAGRSLWAYPMLLAVLALGLAMLGGCTTAAVAWEAGAAQQIRAANDNALTIWKMGGCAMPVGAVLRDPDVIDTVNRFCGGAKSQLGANQPINITVQVPAAPASSAKP